VYDTCLLGFDILTRFRRFEGPVVDTLWTYLPNDAASPPRRPSSFNTPLWEPPEPHTSLLILFQIQLAWNPVQLLRHSFTLSCTCSYLSAVPSGMPDIEAQVFFSLFWPKETFFVPYFSQYRRSLSFPAFLCINGIQVPDLVTDLWRKPRSAERVAVPVWHVGNGEVTWQSQFSFIMLN